jgi:hypothetical protein
MLAGKSLYLRDGLEQVSPTFYGLVRGLHVKVTGLPNRLYYCLMYVVYTLRTLGRAVA